MISVSFRFIAHFDTPASLAAGFFPLTSASFSRKSICFCVVKIFLSIFLPTFILPAHQIGKISNFRKLTCVNPSIGHSDKKTLNKRERKRKSDSLETRRRFLLLNRSEKVSRGMLTTATGAFAFADRNIQSNL